MPLYSPLNLDMCRHSVYVWGDAREHNLYVNRTFLVGVVIVTRVDFTTS